MIEVTRRRHTGLARNMVGALAKAQHDPRIREMLAGGFDRTRPTVASLLGLGDDEAGRDAAGLTLALFYGLLFQVLLDPDLAIEGGRLERAQARLRGGCAPDPNSLRRGGRLRTGSARCPGRTGCRVGDLDGHGVALAHVLHNQLLADVRELEAARCNCPTTGRSRRHERAPALAVGERRPSGVRIARRRACSAAAHRSRCGRRR